MAEVQVNGVVLPDGSLQLDGALGLPPGPVVIRARTAQPLPMDAESIAQRQREFAALMEQIHASNHAAGVTPRTAAEIDQEIAEGRAADEERMRRNEAAFEGR